MDIMLPESYEFDVTRMRPFQKKSHGFLSCFFRESIQLLADKKSKRIFFLLLINVACSINLFVTCASTNSMSLTAFSYLSVFDLLSLASCFLSVWIQQQRPDRYFSFGLERGEVVAVFVCTTITQLGGFFVIKESVERIFQQQNVTTDGQILGAISGLVVHLIVTYGVENKPFAQVSNAASSSWLQETTADFNKSICGLIPVLSKYLLPRLNPYALLAEAAAAAVLFEVLLVDYKQLTMIDTTLAIVISALTCITMLPLSAHSGMILLQTTPTDMMDRIDKCLREAIILDGLLELKNEHFWTVSFGCLAGSLQVRIRRDANEQLILAQLTSKLSPYVQHLTIQISKDDWNHPSLSFAPEAPSFRGDSWSPGQQIPATIDFSRSPRELKPGLNPTSKRTEGGSTSVRINVRDSV